VKRITAIDAPPFDRVQDRLYIGNLLSIINNKATTILKNIKND